MAVLVKKEFSFAIKGRPRRESCHFSFAMSYKSGGKKYRRCNKQDYDPVRRAVAHSIYTPNCTTRYFYHRSLPSRINNARVLTISSKHWIYFTLCSVFAFLLSDALKNCEKHRWIKVREVEHKFTKFETPCEYIN